MWSTYRLIRYCATRYTNIHSTAYKLLNWQRWAKIRNSSSCRKYADQRGKVKHWRQPSTSLLGNQQTQTPVNRTAFFEIKVANNQKFNFQFYSSYLNSKHHQSIPLLTNQKVSFLTKILPVCIFVLYYSVTNYLKIFFSTKTILINFRWAGDCLVLGYSFAHHFVRCQALLLTSDLLCEALHQSKAIS